MIILRQPGELVPQHVSHDKHLPKPDRATFWFKVLTSGEWDRVANAYADASADVISDSQLAYIALGVALARVDNLHVQRGTDKPEPFKLERHDDGSLDPEHCSVLLPLIGELMAFVQASGIVSEQDRKNS